jgi:hypothetical protein
MRHLVLRGEYAKQCWTAALTSFDFTKLEEKLDAALNTDEDYLDIIAIRGSEII